jgi:hypothetical protein
MRGETAAEHVLPAAFRSLGSLRVAVSGLFVCLFVDAV